MDFTEGWVKKLANSIFYSVTPRQLYFTRTLFFIRKLTLKVCFKVSTHFCLTKSILISQGLLISNGHNSRVLKTVTSVHNEWGIMGYTPFIYTFMSYADCAYKPAGSPGPTEAMKQAEMGYVAAFNRYKVPSPTLEIDEKIPNLLFILVKHRESNTPHGVCWSRQWF